MTRDIIKSVGEIIDEKMYNQAQRKKRSNTFEGERAATQYLNTTRGEAAKSLQENQFASVVGKRVISKEIVP
jgi:hypothetical protein